MTKCTRCTSGKTVVDLDYTKESLCENCFKSFFERRFRRTIRRNKLLKPDDKVAVALSGGKDSVVLTYLLKKISSKAPKSEIFAITIDEGVEGYSSETLKIAKELCSDLEIEHHIFTYKKELDLTLDAIIKKTKDIKNAPLACSYCGVFRRQLLNMKARELGATKVATGHNLDDETQVALMNFVRGDLEELVMMSGMIGNRSLVTHIKPLRESPENEVAKFGRLSGLQVNFSKCPYSHDLFRESMRDTVGLLEENYVGSTYQLLRSVDTLMPILRDHYKNRTGQKSKRCRVCGEPSPQELCKFCQMKNDLGIS